MRILVTGGAGFIGSHLIDRLLAEGHSVIAMDNLITGSTDNIQHLAGRDDFLFIKHNITNYIYLPEPVEAVVHLASPASPSQTSPTSYLQLPIQTLKVGAIGTLNALGVAKAHNARFLITSTSEIYGDPLEHPQKESYWGHVNPIGPRSVYDEAKRFAEALTMAYHRTHGVNTCIVRIFNTYGPRMDINDGRVVPNFMRQALNGNPLTIYGKGEQTRSFCYVSDQVEGIYRLLMSGEHQPVNIGNPAEITILELADTINRLTANPGGIIYEDRRTEGDPERRRPDISRAGQVLGWEPTVDLEVGLKHTIDYFRTRI